MMDSEIQVAQDVPETTSSAVPFKFAISWRSLTRSRRLTTAPPSGSDLFAGRAPALESQMNPFEGGQPVFNAPDKSTPISEAPTTLRSTPNLTRALNTSSLRKWAALLGLAMSIVMFALAGIHDGEASSHNRTPVQKVQMGGTGWISEG